MNAVDKLKEIIIEMIQEINDYDALRKIYTVMNNL